MSSKPFAASFSLLVLVSAAAAAASGDGEISALEARAGGSLVVVEHDAVIDDSFRDELVRAGVEVLQYLPENSYLAWAPRKALGEVERRPRWRRHDPVHKLARKLEQSVGPLRLLVVPEPSLGGAVQTLRDAGLVIRSHTTAQPDGRLVEVVAWGDGAAAPRSAELPTVAWIERAPRRPSFGGEAATAEVLHFVDGGGAPQAGVRDLFGELGVDGSGVRWAVVDSGVDRRHPDLPVEVGVDFPGCPSDPPGDDPGPSGHGTAVAGLLAGTAATGMGDAEGFLYGLGVAPGAGLVAHSGVNIQCGGWPPADGWQVYGRDVLRAGAVGSNNSWTTDGQVVGGYTMSERTHDLMVRDGDFETPDVAEPLILVFIAGNAGPDPHTLKPPAEAKNLIVVGATDGWRGDRSDERLADFSGRGPTADGRIAPTVVAPGFAVTSSLHRDESMFLHLWEIPDTDGMYMTFEGTSAAAPVVSGALALWVERWRQRHAGRDPSPAMARAVLVHTAEELGGDPPPPPGDQGWGRLRADRMIAPADSRVELDQRQVLSAPGAVWEGSFGVTDPTRPVVVTVAWTDAPAMPGAGPALVNDLDLVVSSAGATVLGNTTPGDPLAAADRRNTVERVVLPMPGDRVDIRVEARNLPGDGVPLNGDPTDQDFALLCDNCRRPPPAPSAPISPPVAVR